MNNENPKYTASEQLALDTYIKMMRSTNSVADSVNESWQEVGLTVSQFGVLEALYHIGPLCQRDIAKKILKTTGNITMVIDNLSRRGLVERKKDQKDRRYYSVHLTPKGKKLIARIFPDHVKEIARSMSILSSSEQKKLGEICKKLGMQLNKR